VWRRNGRGSIFCVRRLELVGLAGAALVTHGDVSLFCLILQATAGSCSLAPWCYTMRAFSLLHVITCVVWDRFRTIPPPLFLLYVGGVCNALLILTLLNTAFFFFYFRGVLEQTRFLSAAWCHVRMHAFLYDAEE
jgi:hypothetical protein